jgi:hypothetical protein
MTEDQVTKLINIINTSDGGLMLEEILKLIKEKYGLNYSPEQLVSHPEFFEILISK